MTDRPAFRLISAAGVADATGACASPGAMLIECGSAVRVLAVGTPRQVASHPAAGSAERVDRPDAVLIPGLVNAHTHLDLTSVGPRAYDRKNGFSAWLSMVMRHRATDPQDIHRAVGEGVARSLAGGVVAVGDIAGTGRLEAAEALRASPLLGVSFVEYFGNGGVPDGLRSMAAGRVRMGVQPHAPYSAGPDLYRAALASGMPLSTHLAESMAERELLTRGTGPMRAFLESIGVWSDVVAARFGGVGGARTAVDYLREFIGSGEAIVLAHVNDADDADIELLEKSNCSVVYCPRSHEYFGNDVDLGPHRYREMLDAGINVALGTDSIINVPSAQSHRLSTLDEMRLLRERDGTDPGLLLRMATVNGARALGLNESLFDFSAGEIAGVAAVDVQGTDPTLDPLTRVMEAGEGIALLAGANA
ncbi:MAG: amidohydrolase family protein [Phycisphaeraceae bacterium]|nr:amidohydrolase family protein [Phycisphaerales bacterium]MCB9843295.1 amidohydrolase family protein [Phycisphaeraceae bacterium]